MLWFLLGVSFIFFIFESVRIIIWYKTDDFVKSQVSQPNFVILWTSFLTILSLTLYFIPNNYN